MSSVIPLLKRVAETISRYNMAAPRNRVGVAVSGGADSIALLRALVELAPALSLELTVLHVNHRLRGPDSDADEEFVRQAAASHGLPFAGTVADAREGSGNLEDRARRQRHAFFAAAMRDHALDRVAVGHTRSDQAETVLMRLLRGAGPDGLRGIHPVTRAGIVRPLIEIDRAEVRQWLVAAGVAWREDTSNGDPRFLRNRTRMELLPVLERDWNPALPKLLAQTARLAFEDSHYWEQEVARRFGEVAEAGETGVVLRLDALNAMPAALVRRLLREAVRRVRGDLDGIDFEHDERLFELARGSRGEGGISLPGVAARRSFRQIRLGPPAETEDYQRPLPIPGRVELPGAVSLSVEPVRHAPESRYNTDDPGLDWMKVQGRTLVVRNWQPGDAYWPVGAPKVRKLKQLFEKARIPSWERAGWPMILCEGGIIWTRRFGPALDWAAAREAETVLRVSETRQGE